MKVYVVLFEGPDHDCKPAVYASKARAVAEARRFCRTLGPKWVTHIHTLEVIE